MRTHVRELLKTFPEFGYASRLLYLRPVTEILVGYLIESPPAGPRLTALRVPLYVLADQLQLTYAERIADFRPNGELLRSQFPTSDSVFADFLDRPAWSQQTEREFAVRVGEFISAHRGRLLAMQDVHSFARDLRQRIGDQPLRDPIVSKTYAMTLIVLGEYQAATALLTAISAVSIRDPASIRDIHDTLSSLSRGSSSALAYRSLVVQEMRSRLGITG
jgi:hypothetical protein